MRIAQFKLAWLISSRLSSFFNSPKKLIPSLKPTDIAPENWWLEDYVIFVPFWVWAYFQRQTVSFRDTFVSSLCGCVAKAPVQSRFVGHRAERLPRERTTVSVRICNTETSSDESTFEKIRLISSGNQSFCNFRNSNIWAGRFLIAACFGHSGGLHPLYILASSCIQYQLCPSESTNISV